MTWVTKSNGGDRTERSALSPEETRSELEEFGICVLESELHRDSHAHRIDARHWRRLAKRLLAAGFVPRPDNDYEPVAAASATTRE